MKTRSVSQKTNIFSHILIDPMKNKDGFHHTPGEVDLSVVLLEQPGHQESDSRPGDLHSDSYSS